MKRTNSPRKQRGVTLFVGLMVLLVLTILSLVIIQVITMQERMARNLRDQSYAFQAAESALRGAERLINSGVAPYSPFTFDQFTSGCVNSRCLPSTTTPQWQSVGWGPTSTTTTAVTTLTLSGVADPRYVIELLSGNSVFDSSLGCTPALFRISARGFGPNGAETNLQSLFRYKPLSC